MKQLLLGVNGKPVLEEYEDQPLQAGYVRVVSDHGAPKHGTERTGMKRIPLPRFIMMRIPIFSDPGRKSLYMTEGPAWEICG